MPEETLDERGTELRATRTPTAEAREIKKLRKKQQRLLNIIAQLRQKIRSLKASLRIRRTVRRKRRTNAAGSCQKRRQRAYRHFVGQYSADRPTAGPTSTENQMSFHLIWNNRMPFRNKLLYQITHWDQLLFQSKLSRKTIFHLQRGHRTPLSR